VKSRVHDFHQWNLWVSSSSGAYVTSVLNLPTRRHLWNFCNTGSHYRSVMLSELRIAVLLWKHLNTLLKEKSRKYSYSSGHVIWLYPSIVMPEYSTLGEVPRSFYFRNTREILSRSCILIGFGRVRYIILEANSNSIVVRTSTLICYRIGYLGSNIENPPTEIDHEINGISWSHPITGNRHAFTNYVMQLNQKLAVLFGPITWYSV